MGKLRKIMADNQGKKKADKAADFESGSFKSVSIADIKELFTLMQENEIAELEIEQKDTKIHIVSKGAPPVQQVSQVMPFMPGMSPMMNMAPAVAAQAVAAPAPVAAPVSESAPAASGASDSALPANAKTINSPMVGTFYSAPTPDAPSFVKEGDRVNEESVMCIIEAMKLMNEIKAEMKGKVIRVLVENGMPVEFNQPLFVIEP